LWTVGVTYGFAPHTLKEEVPDMLVDSAWQLGSILSGEPSKP
jgi:hypothetical protein